MSLSLQPFHILTYGTLLGTELYQTFIMTKICHRTLPISQFTQLQKRVFPAYFQIQTLLIIATAVTHPPASISSLVMSQKAHDAITFGIMLASAISNLMVFGPRTNSIMMERVHQETRDGRKCNDLEDVSEDMTRLNRAFSRAHAMSIHLNLITILSSVYYGFSFASRFELRN